MTSTSNGPSGTTDMHKTGQQTLISFDDGNQASTDEMDVQRALSPDISVDTQSIQTDASELVADASSDSIGPTHRFIFGDSRVPCALPSRRSQTVKADTPTSASEYSSPADAPVQVDYHTPIASPKHSPQTKKKASDLSLTAGDIQKANQAFLYSQPSAVPHGMTPSPRYTTYNGAPLTPYSQPQHRSVSSGDGLSPSRWAPGALTPRLTKLGGLGHFLTPESDHKGDVARMEYTRWLRITGLPQTLDSKFVLDVTFCEFGVLQGIWARRLASDGMIIVGYCDIRAATKAQRVLRHERFFNDRVLDAQYINRAALEDLASEGADMFLGPNTGEIAISVAEQGRINQQTLYTLFAAFGDIRAFRAVLEQPSQLWLCEYFDTRDAAAALQLNACTVEGHLITVSFHSTTASPFFPDAGASLISRTHAIDRLRRPSPVHRTDSLSYQYGLRSPSMQNATDRPQIQRSNSYRSFQEEERLNMQSVDNGRRSSAYETQIELDTAAAIRAHSLRVQGTNELPSSTPEEGPELQGSYFTPMRKFSSVAAPGQDGNSLRRTLSNDKTPITTPPSSSPLVTRLGKTYAERARLAPPAAPKLTRAITYDASTKAEQIWRRSEPLNAIIQSTDTSPLSSPSGETRNKVEFGAIARGKDDRTTLMIKNIPNKITQKELKQWIDQTSEGCYSFLYLRMDFSSKANVGYAFIDFICPSNIITFSQARVGTTWNVFGSEKICDVSYANIQGQEALIDKFRNSCVMDEQEEYRPRIYHTSGPLKGLEAPFPEPNNLNKKARSIRDAQQIGLYPPSSPCATRLSTPIKNLITSPLSRSHSLRDSSPIRLKDQPRASSARPK